jgi:hypothetical protein
MIRTDERFFKSLFNDWMVNKGEVNLKAGSEFVKQRLIIKCSSFYFILKIFKYEENPNTVSQ